MTLFQKKDKPPCFFMAGSSTGIVHVSSLRCSKAINLLSGTDLVYFIGNGELAFAFIPASMMFTV